LVAQWVASTTPLEPFSRLGKLRRLFCFNTLFQKKCKRVQLVLAKLRKRCFPYLIASTAKEGGMGSNNPFELTIESIGGRFLVVAHFDDGRRYWWSTCKTITAARRRLTVHAKRCGLAVNNDVATKVEG
jgi:hypothetical protein